MNLWPLDVSQYSFYPEPHLCRASDSLVYISDNVPYAASCPVGRKIKWPLLTAQISPSAVCFPLPPCRLSGTPLVQVWLTESRQRPPEFRPCGRGEFFDSRCNLPQGGAVFFFCVCFFWGVWGGGGGGVFFLRLKQANVQARRLAIAYRFLEFGVSASPAKDPLRQRPLTFLLFSAAFAPPAARTSCQRRPAPSFPPQFSHSSFHSLLSD